MIETKRMIFEPIRREDFERHYCVMFQEDPIMRDFFAAMPEETKKKCWESLTVSCETYSLFRKEDHQFLGEVDIHEIEDGELELGITLLKVYQNQGYGPEAVKGLTDWLYQERHQKQVVMHIEPENSHSQHMFEKMGAVNDGLYLRLPEGLMKAAKEQLSEQEVQKIRAVSAVRKLVLDLPVKEKMTR